MNLFTSISSIRYLVIVIIGAISAAGATLFVANLALAMLPVNGGFYRANPSSTHSSARYVPHQDYTFSLGWDLRNSVKGKINGDGFVSPYEYDGEKPVVALVGDSFSEALMLKHSDSIAGRLQKHFGSQFQVQNYGISGAALPHYLGIGAEMKHRYQFIAAILLVTPSDYEEGFSEQPGYYHWNKHVSSGEIALLAPEINRTDLTEFIRELPLVRYIRFHLKFNFKKMFVTPFRQHGCRGAVLSDADRMRIRRYIEALPIAYNLPVNKIVLVMNERAADIYGRVDGLSQIKHIQCPSRDALAMEYLEREATAYGMELVKAGKILELHYRKDRKLFDFSPADHHWNGHGAQIITNAVVNTKALWKYSKPN